MRGRKFSWRIKFNTIQWLKKSWRKKCTDMKYWAEEDHLDERWRTEDNYEFTKQNFQALILATEIPWAPKPRLIPILIWGKKNVYKRSDFWLHGNLLPPNNL